MGKEGFISGRKLDDLITFAKKYVEDRTEENLRILRLKAISLGECVMVERCMMDPVEYVKDTIKYVVELDRLDLYGLLNGFGGVSSSTSKRRENLRDRLMFIHNDLCEKGYVVDSECSLVLKLMYEIQKLYGMQNHLCVSCDGSPRDMNIRCKLDEGRKISRF